MKTYILYPGRFQPFLKNHQQAYQYLVNTFPDAEVVIVTSNSDIIDAKNDLTFDQKVKVMKEAWGIPAKAIFGTRNLFSPLDFIQTNTVDSENSIIYYAVAPEKNDTLTEKTLKADGTPRYIQKLTEAKGNAETADKHAYTIEIPLPEDKSEDFRADMKNETIDINTRKIQFKNTFGQYFSQEIFDAITNVLPIE